MNVYKTSEVRVVRGERKGPVTLVVRLAQNYETTLVDVQPK